jgi:serine/threonine-protein kinase
VHRDVKPDNIVLGRHQDAYLADWGQARLLPAAPADAGPQREVASIVARRAAAAATGFAGTPAYAAPEQAAGLPASRSDDVFALGGVLFRLLTGRAPRTVQEIGSDELAAWLAAARQRPIPPVRRFARRAPKALAAVCDQALQFRPEDRHVDAAAFAHALEAALLRAR